MVSTDAAVFENDFQRGQFSNAYVGIGLPNLALNIVTDAAKANGRFHGGASVLNVCRRMRIGSGAVAIDREARGSRQIYHRTRRGRGRRAATNSTSLFRVP